MHLKRLTLAPTVRSCQGSEDAWGSPRVGREELCFPRHSLPPAASPLCETPSPSSRRGAAPLLSLFRGYHSQAAGPKALSQGGCSGHMRPVPVTMRC